MRKWMRERLTRRKKTPAETSDQPSPPPLQPAYFDAEQPPSLAGDASKDASESEVPAPPPPVREARPVRRARPSAAGPRSGELHSGEVRSEDQPSEMPPSPAAREVHEPAATPTSNAGRGRRRRGGRGRGGRGREQAVAQAFAPAAVKGSIPVVSEETAADDFSDLGEPEGQTPAPPLAAAAPKVPAIPAAPPRPPKGVVVLAIGLPGSGKSSWFKRHNVVALSSDMVRSLLFDDVREQRFQDLVFSNLRSMLKARLIAKRPMNYVDATNLTPQERQHWIKLAKDYQYEVHAVFFDVPLEVCVERHQRRDRVVPEDVMRRMAAKLKPPAFEEGFAKITVVRVKAKEPAAS
ncbi:MAG: AAA family ATPase [Candidatus Sulfotelmatobacter sp.]